MTDPLRGNPSTKVGVGYQQVIGTWFDLDYAQKEKKEQRDEQGLAQPNRVG